MARRKTWSTSRRAALFKQHGGICHICNLKIDAGQSWDVSHEIPLALGGADDEANARPAHTACHRGPDSRTSDDMARIAKAKRQEAKHIGAKAPPRQKLKSKGFDRDLTVKKSHKPSLPPRRLYEMWKPGNDDTD